MKIYFTLLIIPIVAVALPVYWLALRRDAHRLWFLIAVSLGVLALLHPAFSIVLVALAVAMQQLVRMHKERRISGARAVIVVVATAVITLAVGKYGQRMVGVAFGGDNWVWSHLVMPLGISYFVFRLMQYVFDQVRGVIEDDSIRDLLAFICFLPTLPAGPLETYQGFHGKRSLAFDRGLAYLGLRRIVIGYFKKAFVVDFVIATYFSGAMTDVLRPNYHFSFLHPLVPVAFVISVFIRAYIDLSAYTDLAIGFSALFGFRIMENFDNPLFSKDLGDFWRRWHISLSSWCRNNVYFPVFGATRKVWLGLYASMLTMGLWHYVNLNWTAWALWHGTGLVVVARWTQWRKKRRKQRKVKPGPWRQRLMKPVPYVLTFCYVALGYAFVGTPTFGKALAVWVGCFLGPLVWLKHNPGILIALVVLVAAGALAIAGGRSLRAAQQRRQGREGA